MAWDDDEEEEDWEKEKEPELKPVKKAEWSDEEEEEEELPEEELIKKMREEKAELLKRLAEIDEKLPHEKPKESSKKGKQTKKLLAQKDDEDRKAREEALRADGQVSLQRKIEESDFENAQDMFGGGEASGGGGAGKFEEWKLSEGSKQVEVEAFAVYTAEKVVQFKDQFLYLALLRKLVGKTTESLDAAQVKELLLVLTKGRKDFNVVDLIRNLLRDADKDIEPEDIAALIIKKEEKKVARPGTKDKKPETLTPRAELFKLLLQDFVKDMKPEEVSKIVEDGCGVVLTRDQQTKIAQRRAELAGDPASLKGKGKGSARVADHKSMDMYGAYGTGADGEDWGGGGGTRGDDYDFM